MKLATILPPRKPSDLKSEDVREFENKGIEYIRNRMATISGGHLYASHGPLWIDAVAWVRWQNARSAYWAKVVVIATVLAAVLACAACVLTVIAWRFPVEPSTSFGSDRSLPSVCIK